MSPVASAVSERYFRGLQAWGVLRSVKHTRVCRYLVGQVPWVTYAYHSNVNPRDWFLISCGWVSEYNGRPNRCIYQCWTRYPPKDSPSSSHQASRVRGTSARPRLSHLHQLSTVLQAKLPFSDSTTTTEYWIYSMQPERETQTPGKRKYIY